MAVADHFLTSSQKRFQKNDAVLFTWQQSCQFWKSEIWRLILLHYPSPARTSTTNPPLPIIPPPPPPNNPAHPPPPHNPPPPPIQSSPGDLVTRTGDREIVVVSGRASGMYADRSVCLMSFVQLARKRSIWGRLLRESSTRKENAC